MPCSRHHNHIVINIQEFGWVQEKSQLDVNDYFMKLSIELIRQLLHNFFISNCNILPLPLA